MKISLITGHKADYLIRKETPELKKGFKVFLTLAAIGSFIGFILAYFCKSSTKQDMESLENEETDFTEDDVNHYCKIIDEISNKILLGISTEK